MTPIDLSAVPVVDNHCHGLYREQQLADLVAWRRCLTEGGDAELATHHVASTLFYRRLVRALAEYLQCPPDEDAVLEARNAVDPDVLVAGLLRTARVEALLIDQGFPPPGMTRPDPEVAALAGCRTAPILRLETLMQELIVAQPTLNAVVEALRAALADVRAAGYVALKSIAAYRSGLDIHAWPPVEALDAFRDARRQVEVAGTLRLVHKPLLDTLLHVAFVEAARQEIPVQFHTGYGDTDADLRLANPLHLRAVLEAPAYRAMPVVLLHECYPYTREGGYLAAVYPHVYLDLSYGIPFLSLEEMRAFTRAAVGVAPLSKLLYSSDGVGLPELHWLSALDGRRVLGRVLGECVHAGELTADDAQNAGRAILRENAHRLYRL